MPRDFLKSMMEFIVIGLVLITFVLGGLIVLINYMRAIGLELNTTSDLLALVAVIVSLVTIVTTVGWNYWVFRITSHEYYPALEVEFVSVPPFRKEESDEFIVKLRNIGKRDLIPSKILISGTWFDGERELKIDGDIIQPGQSAKVRAKLLNPDPRHNTVFIKVEDE